MSLLSTLAGGWQAYALVALGTALLTGAAAYKLHSMDVVVIETKRDRQETQALAAVQSKLVQQCNTAKQITSESSNAYETALAANLKHSADPLGVPGCIPVINDDMPASGNANGHHAAPANGKHAGQNERGLAPTGH